MRDRDMTAAGIALALTTSWCAAQGDTCALATPIQGTGTFAFNIQNVTASGFEGRGCPDYTTLFSAPNPASIGHDVWFAWTPLESGDYVLLTANGTEVANLGGAQNMDGQLFTTVAAYDACGGSCVFCQGPGLFECDYYGPCLTPGCGETGQGILIKDVAAGQTLQVRVGNLFGGAGCFLDPISGYLECDAWSGDLGFGDLVIERHVDTAPVQVVCTPAQNHYLGDYARMNDSYLLPRQADRIHVEATNGPPNEFGFFILGPSASSSLPIFQGTLCLDQPISRYSKGTAGATGNDDFNSQGQFDAAGVFSTSLGNSTVGTGFDVPLLLPPVSGGGMMLSGSTYAIQMWYRDQLPGGTPSANFSNAIVVTMP